MTASSLQFRGAATAAFDLKVAPRQTRACALFLFPLALALAAPLRAQSAAEGTIRGTVHSAVTRAFLDGASVQVEGTAMSATTARDGSFTFTHVPAGQYRLTVFYTGLATADRSVTVSAGRQSEVTVALAQRATVLETFTVTEVREGSAASITKQRNAVNLVNVVSMDAYGNVNDGNIGHFLQKLPGVAIKREAGEIVGVGLRGTPAHLNAVMLDGVRTSAAIAGFSPLGDRAPLIDQIPSELIKEIEVFKGITPELPVDSLSGGINMTTKSAFDYRGRFVSLRAGLAQNTSRETLRGKFAPNAALTFLDAFGADRRIGVALTASYSKTHSFRDRVQGNFANVDGRNSNARLLDDIHARVRAGAGTKLEYRFDAHTRVYLDFNTNFFSADSPRMDRSASTSNRNAADYNVVSRAAIIAGAIPRTTTGGVAGIAPGYTDTFTEMLGVFWNNNGEMEKKRSRQNKIGVGLEKKWPDAKLTASTSFNPSTFNNRLWGLDSQQFVPIGLSIDNSKDLSRPIFTQTYGPAIAAPVNFNNYGAAWFITFDNTHEEVTSFRSDYERNFRMGKVFASLKTGVNYRHQYRWNRRYTPLWDVVGRDQVQGLNPATGMNDDDIGQFRLAKPSYGLFNNHYPQFDGLDYRAAERYFDLNPGFLAPRGTSVSYYPPKNIFNESVSAGYLQGRAAVGALTLLGGARYERTQISGQGRLTDARNPALLATTSKGDYSGVFPSLHLRYRIRNNLIAHASYSTSSARPSISNILPTATINYTPGATGIGVVSQGNPSLKPQRAKNYDLSLEYYLEPAGVISAGWFHKDIRDFITARTPRPIIETGADNGFDGRYAGFELATQTNLNNATIDGWEFNYNQRFTWLPKPFNGLGAFANYTRLVTTGSTTVPPAPGTVPNTQLVDFVPNTYNVGLTFDSHGFGARVEYHFKGRYKTGNNAEPMLVAYQSSDKTVDVNLSYRVTRSVTLFVDVVNLFNQSPFNYTGTTSRRQVNEVYGMRVNYGVSGRF